MASKLSAISTAQVVAVSVIIAIVMLFVLVSAGRSFISLISHNSNIIGKKQTAEKQLKSNLSALPQLQQAYNNLGNMHDTINKALPTDSGFPALVATMQVLAGTSNVALTNISPASSATIGLSSTAATTAAAPGVAGIATSSPSPLPFGFTVQVKGNYHDILQFLSNLQLSARPIKISDVQLSGSTSAMTASCSMLTYYYNPTLLQDKTEVVK